MVLYIYKLRYIYKYIYIYKLKSIHCKIQSPHFKYPRVASGSRLPLEIWDIPTVAEHSTRQSRRRGYRRGRNEPKITESLITRPPPSNQPPPLQNASRLQFSKKSQTQDKNKPVFPNQPQMLPCSLLVNLQKILYVSLGIK